MQKLFPVDSSMMLTVLGMLLAIAGIWPLEGEAVSLFSLTGIWLVYLAGGLPATSRALGTLWEERVLDIDLLMMGSSRWPLEPAAPFSSRL